MENSTSSKTTAKAATALILSSKEITRHWDNWETVVHVARFSSLEDLHLNRLLSVQKVTTKYFAWIDDDDELPENTGQQIVEITAALDAADSHLAYTIWEDGRGGLVIPKDFTPSKLKTINALHQLVVMRTDSAQKLAQLLPRGLYYTEPLFYYFLSLLAPPVFYPHVCYKWNRKTTGMSAHKAIGLAQKNTRLFLVNSEQSIIRAMRQR